MNDDVSASATPASTAGSAPTMQDFLRLAINRSRRGEDNFVYPCLEHRLYQGYAFAHIILVIKHRLFH